MNKKKRNYRYHSKTWYKRSKLNYRRMLNRLRLRELYIRKVEKRLNRPLLLKERTLIGISAWSKHNFGVISTTGKKYLELENDLNNTFDFYCKKP